jgi:hypothetical protein
MLMQFLFVGLFFFVTNFISFYRFCLLRFFGSTNGVEFLIMWGKFTVIFNLAIDVSIFTIDPSKVLKSLNPSTPPVKSSLTHGTHVTTFDFFFLPNTPQTVFLAILNSDSGDTLPDSGENWPESGSGKFFCFF